MKTLIGRGARTVSASVIALCATTFAAIAETKEVTLMSPSGSFKVSGELLDFTANTYSLKTAFGQLSVDADAVTCEGDGCPKSLNVAWDVSLWGQRRAFTEHVEKLAELMYERTEGKFEITLHYGGLSGSRENLDGIAAGAFEMAQFCAGYHPEKNPTITVLELPFLGVSTLQQEIEVSRAVYAHPATQADLARWNATLVMPSPQPQNNILGTGNPPTSLAAFEQMRIRATGGVGRAIDALGAEPINLPAPAVQDALEQGEVQAVAFAPHAHMAFNTVQSGQWWTTNLNPGAANCPVVVNTDALEALPDEYRAMFDAAVDEALDHYVANYQGATMRAWATELQNRLIIELTFNDDLRSEINDAVAAPAAVAWIEEKSRNGIPAQELYDLVVGVLGRS